MAELENGERYPAVANVGFRPTVGSKRPTLEVHLLDFKGDLYGASGANLPGAKQISKFFKTDLNTSKVNSINVPYEESKLEAFEFLNDEETLLIYDSEKDGMPTIFKPAF